MRQPPYVIKGNGFMLKKERQAYILHQLNLHNKVLSATLSSEISVSEDTIRRDLLELSEDGKLIKVHGGALSHSFSNNGFYPTRIYAQTSKKIIGQKAAALIKDGMFVLTGGGTTVLEFAKAIPPAVKASFVSGSIAAITEYMHHPNLDVLVLGDRVSKTAMMTVGMDAINKLKHIKADLCIMGINAIDILHGITDNDWDVVQVKQQMIESAQKTVCISISEKLNSFQPVHVCAIKKVHTLITELDPGDPLLKPYADAGLNIL
ncbi:MAG: DeoR/GlpR family DNA-binding transcription regulator [Ferruginibacter sp.]